MNENLNLDLKESEKLEYLQANEWWRTLSQMRRRDIALFTALQGAILTIVGKNLLTLEIDGFALSIIGFLIAIIGFNNEYRLYAYLFNFRKRAIEIEKNHNMSLLYYSHRIVREKRFMLGSSLTFRIYYTIIAIGWVLLWVTNILH